MTNKKKIVFVVIGLVAAAALGMEIKKGITQIKNRSTYIAPATPTVTKVAPSVAAIEKGATPTLDAKKKTSR